MRFFVGITFLTMFSMLQITYARDPVDLTDCGKLLDPSTRPNPYIERDYFKDPVTGNWYEYSRHMVRWKSMGPWERTYDVDGDVRATAYGRQHEGR